MGELETLLEAWRRVRAPQLADAIDIVSRKHAGKRLPKTGNMDAKQERWLARLAACGEDLEPLLDALTDVSGPQVQARLACLCGRDDPRIAGKLAQFVRSPPYVNISSLPFWVALFDILEDLADVRCLVALEGCDADWVQKFRPHMRPKITEAVAEAVPRIGDACAAVPNALEPLEVERLEATYGLTDPKHEASLLDAITVALDDDAPRLVYADWLMETGDPRGELIALMIAGREPARVEALLEEYEKQWLGPLTFAVKSVEWSRGFPVAGHLFANRGADAARAIGDPRWRTFERLSFMPDIVSLLPILTDAALSNLRSLEWLAPKETRHLLGVPRELPLERLGLLFAEGSLKRLSKTLAEATSIPNLKTLALRVHVEERAALDWLLAVAERMARPLALELDLVGTWRLRIDTEPKIVAVEKLTPDAKNEQLLRAVKRLGLPPPKGQSGTVVRHRN